MTRDELESALHALGWRLEGPTRTPGGWKASIQRGTLTVLLTANTAEEVLEGLLRRAKDHPLTAEQVLDAARAYGVRVLDPATGERLILLASLGLDLKCAEIRGALLELHLHGELRLQQLRDPPATRTDLDARGHRRDLVDESVLRDGDVLFHAVVIP